MNSDNSVIEKLKSDQFQVDEVDYLKRGYHIEVNLNKDQVRTFAGNMLDAGFFLDFVTAVHVTSGFIVVYQYAHFDKTCRINAKVMIDEKGEITSISDIYHGAIWHERETHDFYGVIFTGNPDSRPLLLSDEDHDLNPLLKSQDKIASIEAITRKSGEDAEEKPARKTKEE